MEPVDKYQQIENKINELRKINPSFGDNLPEILEIYVDLVEMVNLYNKELIIRLYGFEKRLEILNNFFNTMNKNETFIPIQKLAKDLLSEKQTEELITQLELTEELKKELENYLALKDGTLKNEIPEQMLETLQKLARDRLIAKLGNQKALETVIKQFRTDNLPDGKE